MGRLWGQPDAAQQRSYLDIPASELMRMSSTEFSQMPAQQQGLAGCGLGAFPPRYTAGQGRRINFQRYNDSLHQEPVPFIESLRREIDNWIELRLPEVKE